MMKARKCLLIFAPLVVVTGLLLWAVSRKDEPHYAGKPLTAWLVEYQKDYADHVSTYGYHARLEEQNSEAITAIRQIGTNGIPVLLKLAGAKHHPIKARVIALLRRQSFIGIRVRTAEECQGMASVGFYVLGPLGQDAIPSLIELLNCPDRAMRSAAADCLGNIGPTAKVAVPYLVQFLRETNRIVRWGAMVNLGRIRMEPELVVPILVTHLTTTNELLATTISTPNIVKQPHQAFRPFWNF